MAIIFTDDFESYTLGESIDDAGPLAAVWDAGSENAHYIISASQTHDGAQSLWDNEGGNGVSAQVYPGGLQPHGSVAFWFWYTVNGAGDHGVGAAVSLAAGGTAFGFAESGQDLLFYNIWDGTSVIVPNVFVPSTWQHFRLVWRMSTVLPDASDVAADGCCLVYVDGVQIVSFSGLRLAAFDDGWVDASSPNRWDTLQLFTARGHLDGIVVTDDAHTCVGVIPPTGGPPPNPCCGDEPPTPDGPPGTPPPGGNPGPVPGPDPVLPPIWTPQCAGGGTVPLMANEVDSESWV